MAVIYTLTDQSYVQNTGIYEQYPIQQLNGIL